MSLVGTRPPTVDEWDKYELHHRARLATKPGLTGMWQVSGRSNITDFGWHDHVETLCFENGKSTSSRVFKELFYGHTVLRPSCYECPYKSVIHPGDITIADYWGIEKAAPEFDDNKGVSLVLVNNEAGEKIFEKVKKRLIWKQTKLEDSMQPPLKAPFPKPDNREQFWSDFENKSFEYVAKKYGGIGLKNDATFIIPCCLFLMSLIIG